MVTVGVPRALLFYEYFAWWETFLEALGDIRVVASGETTKETLDRGVLSAVDEACLPVKVFYGHVAALKDKVDFLFVPRVVSVAKGEYTCPKLLGLPDMMRAGFDSLPPIIDSVLDVRRFPASWFRWAYSLGRSLKKDPRRILRAYRLAGQRFSRFRRHLLDGAGFQGALRLSGHGRAHDGAISGGDSCGCAGVSGSNEGVSGGSCDGPASSGMSDSAAPVALVRDRSPGAQGGRGPRVRAGRGEAAAQPQSNPSGITGAGDLASLKVGLAGHSYLLYDSLVGMGLEEEMRRRGARVVTSDEVPDQEVKRGASALPRSLFWTYEKKVFGAALSFIRNGLVDGVVQVVSFACGPDSMVGELVESEARRAGIPLLSIVVDEHTGRAGVLTRLEAFLDMLRWRKEKAAR